jgi:hypothetical protein
MTGRCNDCGAENVVVTACTCKAIVCTDCKIAYHSRTPRMGCAAYGGKLLVDEIKKKAGGST